MMFINAKMAFSDPVRQRLNPFNPSLHYTLLTDASRLHGLGYMLVQETPSGRKNIIKCGSVSLRPAQRNYSATEIEGLAVWYATNKCRYFLVGREFDVATDHRALVGLFEKEMRDVDNLRLQKLQEKMMMFNPVVKYIQGKSHFVADALSRRLKFNFMMDGEDCMANVYTQGCCFVGGHEYARRDPKLEPLFNAAKTEVYQLV